MLRYHDHIGWNSSKAISLLVSLGCSLPKENCEAKAEAGYYEAEARVSHKL